MHEHPHTPKKESHDTKIEKTLLSTKDHLGRVAVFDDGLNTRQHTRKEKLANTEVEINTGSVYITPDTEVMDAIEQSTHGKVSHFPVGDVRDDGFGLPGKGESEFSAAIMDRLCDTLLEKYPGKTLALRGIMTSINGLQPGSGRYESDIVDIVDTVSEGIEKQGDVFNVAILDRSAPSLSVHRVTQYASGTAYNRKFSIPSEQADNIFPAILVYDAAGLRKDGQNVWGASFKEDADPGETLLQAYVLDCPNW